MKFRLSAKILIGLSALTVLLIIGGGVTIFYTYRLHRLTSARLAEEIANLKAAQKLEVILFRMRGLMLNYLVDGDLNWLETFEGDKQDFRSWLEVAQTAQQSPEEERILQVISSQFADYENDHRTVLDLHSSGQLAAARARLLRMCRSGFDSLYARCEAFVEANEDAIVAMQKEVERINRFVRWTMYGLAGGGVIIGALMSWIIARGLMKPIYELVLKVRGATGGELVELMKVTPNTELEELDNHVRGLIDRISTTTADLERHRQLLVRADKLAALGKVSAGVAHEIRNPLTAVKMLIYALHEELATNNETRNDLAVIMKELERIERFVQNFLEFARPPDPRLAPVDTNALIHETITLLAPRLRQSRIEVSETYQHHLGAISADADQIKQVVMNLVLNAIEAMPHGGRLEITTQPSAVEKQNFTQICISDTGKGIPAALFDNLFDPFITGRTEGTGLGLAIAHQIITRHGGWIEAKNNPDRGATFVVSLPVE